MSTDTRMINIKLNTPTTPDELKMNSFQKAQEEEERKAIERQWSKKLPNTDKFYLRFYAVGPSSYQILCPLCKQRADTETVKMSGILGQLSCLLSTLSCCFPIFSLSFVYVCLQSRLKSKRMFCNKCGGHLGFYWRPS